MGYTVAFVQWDKNKNIKRKKQVRITTTNTVLNNKDSILSYTIHIKIDPVVPQMSFMAFLPHICVPVKSLHLAFGCLASFN